MLGQNEPSHVLIRPGGDGYQVLIYFPQWGTEPAGWYIDTEFTTLDKAERYVREQYPRQTKESIKWSST